RRLSIDTTHSTSSNKSTPKSASKSQRLSYPHSRNSGGLGLLMKPIESKVSASSIKSPNSSTPLSPSYNYINHLTSLESKGAIVLFHERCQPFLFKNDEWQDLALCFISVCTNGRQSWIDLRLVGTCRLIVSSAITPLCVLDHIPQMHSVRLNLVTENAKYRSYTVQFEGPASADRLYVLLQGKLINAIHDTLDNARQHTILAPGSPSFDSLDEGAICHYRFEHSWISSGQKSWISTGEAGAVSDGEKVQIPTGAALVKIFTNTGVHPWLYITSCIDIESILYSIPLRPGMVRFQLEPEFYTISTYVDDSSDVFEILLYSSDSIQLSSINSIFRDVIASERRRLQTNAEQLVLRGVTDAFCDQTDLDVDTQLVPRDGVEAALLDACVEAAEFVELTSYRVPPHIAVDESSTNLPGLFLDGYDDTVISTLEGERDGDDDMQEEPNIIDDGIEEIILMSPDATGKETVALLSSSRLRSSTGIVGAEAPQTAGKDNSHLECPVENIASPQDCYDVIKSTEVFARGDSGTVLVDEPSVTKGSCSFRMEQVRSQEAKSPEEFYEVVQGRQYEINIARRTVMLIDPKTSKGRSVEASTVIGNYLDQRTMVNWETVFNPKIVDDLSKRTTWCCRRCAQTLEKSFQSLARSRQHQAEYETKSTIQAAIQPAEIMANKVIGEITSTQPHNGIVRKSEKPSGVVTTKDPSSPPAKNVTAPISLQRLQSSHIPSGQPPPAASARPLLPVEVIRKPVPPSIPSPVGRSQTLRRTIDNIHKMSIGTRRLLEERENARLELLDALETVESLRRESEGLDRLLNELQAEVRGFMHGNLVPFFDTRK
ncbi:hypothetical protein SeLEV6574_g08346, partial [Synchytrium endobioticum]